VDEYEQIEATAIAARNLQESAEVLQRLLTGPYAVWTDGSLYSIKVLVAQLDGLRIEVHPREHAPPHFHVRGASVDATFTIAECALLHGDVDGRSRRLIEWWYARTRPLLVTTWNESRPADCLLGSIDE
jgi:hypothetical protein